MAFWNRKINEKELEAEFLDIAKLTKEARDIYCKINVSLQPIEYHKAYLNYHRLNDQREKLEVKILKYCIKTYG